MACIQLHNLSSSKVNIMNSFIEGEIVRVTVILISFLLLCHWEHAVQAEAKLYFINNIGRTVPSGTIAHRVIGYSKYNMFLCQNSPPAVDSIPAKSLEVISPHLCVGICTYLGIIDLFAYDRAHKVTKSVPRRVLKCFAASPAYYRKNRLSRMTRANKRNARGQGLVETL